MIAFPNAKINLGLYVVSKRTDGFHNLETLFYPLPLYDVLEIVSADNTCLFSSGLIIQGDDASNLTLQAYRLLKIKYPSIQPLNIYLHKAIPLGAGMGAWCGLFWQVDRVATVGLSVYGSVLLHEPATHLIRDGLMQGADDQFVGASAYVAAFLVVYVILIYVVRLVRQAIRAARLEGLDRLLGAGLGASKMAVVQAIR